METVFVLFVFVLWLIPVLKGILGSFTINDPTVKKAIEKNEETGKGKEFVLFFVFTVLRYFSLKKETKKNKRRKKTVYNYL